MKILLITHTGGFRNAAKQLLNKRQLESARRFKRGMSRLIRTDRFYRARNLIRSSCKMLLFDGRVAVRFLALSAGNFLHPAGPCTTSKPTIAFVIHDLVGGGAERVISTLANAFADDWNVVVALCFDGASDYMLDPRIRVICRPDPLGVNHFKHLRSIYLALDAAKPDIVMSFLPSMNKCAVAAKILLGSRFKVVVSERNCPHHAYKSRRSRALNKGLYLFADGGVFQTDDALTYWRPWCRRSPVKLPNPLSHVVLEAASRPPATQRTPRIVSVGRLVEQKNHAQLIEAFALIESDFPDFELQIYGKGPLNEELETLVGQLGLDGRVTFAGRVPSDQIAQHIEDASLFVLPSRWEGLPNALIEAMAMGLPCIASDCSIGGPGELVEHGVNGLLVDPGDVEELAEAMRLLLGDPQLAHKLGENARHICDDYDTGAVCQQWSDYLMRILENSR